MRGQWCGLLLLAMSSFAVAQQPMKTQMPMNMSGTATSFVESIEMHATSGTSAEPNSTPTPMLMTMRGDWMVMFHANVFVGTIQQTSPRGGDKFFSTNWFMPMAQRGVGSGAVDAARDVQPGAGDGIRPAISFALSAGRDGVWQADCGWTASA